MIFDGNSITLITWEWTILNAMITMLWGGFKHMTNHSRRLSCIKWRQKTSDVLNISLRVLFWEVKTTRVSDSCTWDMWNENIVNVLRIHLRVNGNVIRVCSFCVVVLVKRFAIFRNFWWVCSILNFFPDQTEIFFLIYIYVFCITYRIVFLKPEA
jgi:hypothetical protein